MSRIEQVMRELSDLRDFYLKVQRRHEAPEPQRTSYAAEDPAGYSANEVERPMPWAGDAQSREQAQLESKLNERHPAAYWKNFPGRRKNRKGLNSQKHETLG